MNASEIRKLIARKARKLGKEKDADIILSLCAEIKGLAESLKENPAVAAAKHKADLEKRLNHAGVNGDIEGLRKLFAEVRGEGYHFKARGDMAPSSCGSYVCGWCGEDEIERHLEDWRFFSFELRRFQYRDGEMNYDNSREYRKWLEQFE